METASPLPGTPSTDVYGSGYFVYAIGTPSTLETIAPSGTGVPEAAGVPCAVAPPDVRSEATAGALATAAADLITVRRERLRLRHS